MKILFNNFITVESSETLNFYLRSLNFSKHLCRIVNPSLMRYPCILSTHGKLFQNRCVDPYRNHFIHQTYSLRT